MNSHHAKTRYTSPELINAILCAFNRAIKAQSLKRVFGELFLVYLHYFICDFQNVSLL